MTTQKILIVTKFFYPDITPRAFRAFELAKEFSRQGHEVTILTTKKYCDFSTLERDNGFKVVDSVNNEPKELQGTAFIGILRFGLKHFFLFPQIVLAKYFNKALKNKDGYDLLISIAFPYPVHFGVAMARKKNKSLAKVWVADCGDPFTGGKETRFGTPFYYKIIENWFCRKPNFITIPIEEAKKAYPKFCHSKIYIIPQGFDIESIKPNYNYEENKVITFAYAGNLSPGLRDPRAFINYLYSLDLDFKFIIYTRNSKFLDESKVLLGDKLEIRDYVPRNMLLKELGKMDFLVNLENRTSIHSPSKLIDYALLERPILSIKPFAIDKKLINEFINGDYSNALKIRNIEEYAIRNVANKFLELTKMNS